MNHLGRVLRELLARRVPQLLGAYLLGCWGVLEFIDWLVQRYGWSPGWVDAGLAAFLTPVPVVVLLAWHHGAPGRDPWRRSHRLLVALGLLAACSVGWWVQRHAPTQPVPAPITTAEPNSVAVLPFRDLSDTGEEAYLADGIAAEIRSALSRVAGMRVASATSAEQFRDQRQDVRDIGARLNVANVLEGSVRLDGARIRVSVQFVNASDGFERWGESYERRLDDVFAIQDDIALAVIDALELRRQEDQWVPTAARHSHNLDAYDHYLRGRYFWNKRDQDSLRQAVAQFQAALAIDPEYAAAYSGLSDCYVSYYDYGLMPLAESTAAARDAAEHALALDPMLAEAHTSLAHVALHAWQWNQAEGSFRKALALDPQSAQARHWYALALTALGRLDEAVEMMRQARDLEPLSVLMNADYGMALYAAHRFDAAIEQEQRTLELDPQASTALWILGLSQEGTGNLEKAIGTLEHALAINPGSENLASSLIHTLAAAGHMDAATQQLAALLERAQAPEFPAYAMAVAYVGVGDPDAAFEWLGRTVETRSGWVRYLKVDPRLDPLREDPRFTELLAAIGLP